MQTFNNGQKNKEIQSIKVELHVSTNKNQFDGIFCKTWVCILNIRCNGDGPFKLIVYDVLFLALYFAEFKNGFCVP